MNIELHIIIFRIGPNNISTFFQTTGWWHKPLPAPFRGRSDRSAAGSLPIGGTHARENTETQADAAADANDWSSILWGRFGGIECGHGGLGRKILNCLCTTSTAYSLTGERVLDATVADQVNRYLRNHALKLRLFSCAESVQLACSRTVSEANRVLGLATGLRQKLMPCLQRQPEHASAPVDQHVERVELDVSGWSAVLKGFE